jgi:hypothetical protein
MNVDFLLQEESAYDLLADGNWKRTDYYELDSGSQYFGCVNLITLSKQVTTDEAAALVYLFQRIYNGVVIKDDVMVSANELLQWLIGAGYIGCSGGANSGAGGSSEGARLPLPIAAYKVQEIVQTQLQTKEIRVFKNGQEIPPVSPFNAHEVLAVTAFLDKEDEYLYFIETDTVWVYFNGGIGA